MHSHCWRCRLYCVVDRCPSILFNVPIDSDSSSWLVIFILEPPSLRALLQCDGLRDIIMLVIVVVPSSSTMYLRGTILLVVVVAGLCHSCGAATFKFKNPLWRGLVQKSTPVAAPVTTGLSIASWLYPTAGPWHSDFSDSRVHTPVMVSHCRDARHNAFMVYFIFVARTVLRSVFIRS
jgi:hypothetical protein